MHGKRILHITSAIMLSVGVLLLTNAIWPIKALKFPLDKTGSAIIGSSLLSTGIVIIALSRPK